MTTEAQFLPASQSNKTLVYLCMHTCLHIGTLCISENSCSFEWGTERERRNVTVSVLMWNPFHVKFSFSDDNFSKPTANLEMFLISPSLLLSSMIVASNSSGMGVIEAGLWHFLLECRARMKWLIKQVFSEGECVCSGGEQVLGVNNVTSFAPRRPYRYASTVLSAFLGHKGMPVGNGVAVRAEAEKWSLHLEFIHFALLPLPPPPSSLPPSPLLHREAECKQQMGFRKCVVD